MVKSLKKITPLLLVSIISLFLLGVFNNTSTRSKTTIVEAYENTKSYKSSVLINNRQSSDIVETMSTSIKKITAVGESVKKLILQFSKYILGNHREGDVPALKEIVEGNFIHYKFTNSKLTNYQFNTPYKNTRFQSQGQVYLQPSQQIGNSDNTYIVSMNAESTASCAQFSMVYIAGALSDTTYDPVQLLVATQKEGCPIFDEIGNLHRYGILKPNFEKLMKNRGVDVVGESVPIKEAGRLYDLIKNGGLAIGMTRGHNNAGLTSKTHFLVINRVIESSGTITENSKVFQIYSSSPRNGSPDNYINKHLYDTYSLTDLFDSGNAVTVFRKVGSDG